MSLYRYAMNATEVTILLTTKHNRANEEHASCDAERD